MNRKQRKHARMLEVRVFHVELAYGGPEEGGWWYDTGTLERFVSKATFFNRAKAWDFRDQVQDTLPKPRFPYHSAASHGEQRALVVSFSSPDYFPVRRPHYE